MLIINENRDGIARPLTAQEKTMVSFKEILHKMIAPDEEDTEDYTDSLHRLAEDNEKVSRLLAKNYIRLANETHYDDEWDQTVTKIGQFLQISDSGASLKTKRLEWVLGIAQLNYRRNYITRKIDYGSPTIEFIHEQYYRFISGVIKGEAVCVLGILHDLRMRSNQLECAKLLNAIIDWCLSDREVARYIFDSPPASARFAGYADILFAFGGEIQKDVEAKVAARRPNQPADERDPLILELCQEVASKQAALG